MIKSIYWAIIINIIIPTIAFAENDKDNNKDDGSWIDIEIDPNLRKLISETLGSGIGSIIKGLIVLALVSWLADILLDPLNKKDVANKIYLLIM
jgi:hypothetical protein